jgi:hypothetical protein
VLRVLSVSGAWTDNEIFAVLMLYRSMWIYATEGVDYNKAAMIREARGIDKHGQSTRHGPLYDRSKGSIEMKLMNVTAALGSIGRDDLSMAEHGYRPMSNMQKSLKDAVVTWASGYKRVERKTA